MKEQNPLSINTRDETINPNTKISNICLLPTIISLISNTECTTTTFLDDLEISDFYLISNIQGSCELGLLGR